MLKKQFIINHTQFETRIAALDGAKLTDLYFSRPKTGSMMGHIYKGKIDRILPNMQAAFVDIGLDRSAFLLGSDVLTEEMAAEFLKSGQNGEEPADDEEIEQYFRSHKKPIEKTLKEGQEVLVQVVKDSIGMKGPRVSMFISLPGRYLVLMPLVSHVGISRKISDQSLRQRLKKLAKGFNKDNLGVIFRTAAASVSDEITRNDFFELENQWKTIKDIYFKTKMPELVFEEISAAKKLLRDHFDQDVEKIVVDDKKVFEELKDYAQKILPEAVTRLDHYHQLHPIFDVYGIELEIQKCLERRIDLPSGGHLVIDQTEALTSFDVNSGRFVSRSNPAEAIYKINLEAAEVIAWQIRLRNLGGIIVLDFIDMEVEQHKEKLFLYLQDLLKDDRARPHILKVNEFGLVQMTRKRTSESIPRLLTTECPKCQGRGFIKSVSTEFYDFIREIKRYCARNAPKKLTVKLTSALYDLALIDNKHEISEIAKNYRVHFKFEKMKREPRLDAEKSFVIG